MRGLLEGLQRYDITSKITFSISTLRAILLVAVALAGGRLRELVLVEVAMAALDFAASALAARSRVPGFRFFPRPDRAALRELFSFGLKLEIAHAAHLVTMHLDKLLLTAFLGLEAVAYYDLGAKVAGVMRGLPLLLVSATLPVAATLDAAGKSERLWSFYERGTLALAWTGVPLFLWAAIGAGPLLFAWAGVVAIEAQLTVWILCAGMFVNVYSGMANSVAIGIGKPELEMRRSLIAGALNILLSCGLIMWLGFPGAPLGTALALIAGTFYLMASLHLNLGRSVHLLFTPLLAPLLTAIPAAFAAWVILRFAADGLVANLAGLAAAAVVIALIFALAGRRCGVFTRDFLHSVRNPASDA